MLFNLKVQLFNCEVVHSGDAVESSEVGAFDDGDIIIGKQSDDASSSLTRRRLASDDFANGEKTPIVKCSQLNLGQWENGTHILPP